MTESKIKEIKPKYTKEIINSLAGSYFVRIVANGTSPIDDDISIANLTITMANLVDMQQFIILYYLLLRNNGIKCNFDFLIKYQDGYGVNGQWMRHPVTTNLSNYRLIDNITNSRDSIDAVLESTIDAFAKCSNSNKLKPEFIRILTREEFIYHLLPMPDLQERITKYINLGWHDNEFTYNDAVDQAVNEWSSQYTDYVINNYTIMVKGNGQDKARIIMPKNDSDYLIKNRSDLLSYVAGSVFGNNPLWIKFDHKSNQLVIDEAGYKK